MNQQASRTPSAAALLAALLLPACHSDRPEPAPAPTKFELVPAAPGALGARAAGTDAAPPPPSDQQPVPDPEDDSEDSTPDAGAPLDGGAVPGVAL